MWLDLSSAQGVTAFSISAYLEEARALILNATTPYAEKRSGHVRRTTCMHTNIASYSPSIASLAWPDPPASAQGLTVGDKPLRGRGSG